VAAALLGTKSIAGAWKRKARMQAISGGSHAVPRFGNGGADYLVRMTDRLYADAGTFQQFTTPLASERSQGSSGAASSVVPSAEVIRGEVRWKHAAAPANRGVGDATTPGTASGSRWRVASRAAAPAAAPAAASAAKARATSVWQRLNAKIDPLASGGGSRGNSLRGEGSIGGSIRGGSSIRGGGGSVRSSGSTTGGIGIRDSSSRAPTGAKSSAPVRSGAAASRLVRSSSSPWGAAGVRGGSGVRPGAGAAAATWSSQGRGAVLNSGGVTASEREEEDGGHDEVYAGVLDRSRFHPERYDSKGETQVGDE